MQIRYTTLGRQGIYDYRLDQDYLVQLSIKGETIRAEGLILTTNGLLIIREGYRWNATLRGEVCSEQTLRASLVHDALYTLLLLNELGETWRRKADQEFRNICVQDRVPVPLANVFYWKAREMFRAITQPSLDLLSA